MASSTAERTSIEHCATLAHILENSPDDVRLELQFRKAVDGYAELLQQRITERGGLEADSLPLANEAAAAQCTVDLDLRFMGEETLAKQAERLHATVGDGPLVGPPMLMQAIMKCRAAGTGYMASAPPTSDLENFFDLTMRKGGLRGGKLTKRMLWIDHKERAVVLVRA